MNGLGPAIERALHSHRKELSVIRAGAHVIDITAVADLLAGAVRLGFVLVVHSVEPPVKIVLVAAPRHPVMTWIR